MSTYNFQSDFLKLVFLSFYSIILNGASHERKRKKEKELKQIRKHKKKKPPHQIIVKGFALTNSTTSPSTGKNNNNKINKIPSPESGMTYLALYARHDV